MKTLRQGWNKKHIGCGGVIRLVETLKEDVPWEFDFECVECGEYSKADKIEFRLEGKVVDMEFVKYDEVKHTIRYEKIENDFNGHKEWID